MKRPSLLSLSCAITGTFCLASFALDTLPGLKPDRLSLSGYGSFVNTRITGFYNRNLERWPEWNNFTVLNLIVNMKFAECFTGHIGIEGYSYHNTVSLDNALMPQFKERLNTALYPHQVEGIFSFGDTAVFQGEIGAGLMPYKYNRDAWSLGEYLFRSGTYPGYLITDFDWAVARLRGFRLSTVAFGHLKNDLLFTINMEYPPFRDGNLTWIGSYTYNNMVDIGAGISFCSILSADERLTTPSNALNFQYSDTIVDPVLGPIITDHYYTFRGTKLMGRLALDLLCFMKDGPLFSCMGIPFGFTRDDGRVYAEVAVLGVKNQKPLYGDIKERMPVMFGFNFPTLGLFDALSLQAEYYGYPYGNDYGGAYSHAQPGYAAPFDVTLGSLNAKDSALFANDNWKWSIHARRFIGPHFGIVLQAARDHWRTMTTYDGHRDYGDALLTHRHWYLGTKLVVVF